MKKSFSIKRNRASTTFLILITLFCQSSHSHDYFRGGLKEPTRKESYRLLKNTINEIKPNELYKERISRELLIRGLKPNTTSLGSGVSTGSDSLGNKLGAESGIFNEIPGSTIPSYVDNSNLPAFPAIADQQSQNSCVGWSTTYYQMSHEVCLATPGCNNKISPVKVFSPRWTYSMINGGYDYGAYFSDAFSLTEKHGAALITEFPYKDSDYKSWDLNSDHWRLAINSKMATTYALSVNNQSGINNLKKVLANGHVVTFGTYAGSWQTDSVKFRIGDPNSFRGELIITRLIGRIGGHAMTIVGYDDSIWADINHNGIIEYGEIGAFKVANSWGKGWGNSGFTWVSYDALRTRSKVPDMQVPRREPFIMSGYVYVRSYIPYQPKLLAKVKISHLIRNQISLEFGSSSKITPVPTIFWTPAALINSGGPYSFDGTAKEIDGEFYFDISSLSNNDNALDKIFYLMPTDNSPALGMLIKSFEVIDAITGKVIASSQNLPLYLDDSSSIIRAMPGSIAPDTRVDSVKSEKSIIASLFSLDIKNLLLITIGSIKFNWPE